MSDYDMDTAAQIVEVADNLDTPIYFLKAYGSNACDENGRFSYASTVAFSTTIFLHPIPKPAFNSAINGIEEILAHETIHIAIYQLGLEDESCKFDNICGNLGDWDKMLFISEKSNHE
jgi:hypothetical protein